MTAPPQRPTPVEDTRFPDLLDVAERDVRYDVLVDAGRWSDSLPHTAFVSRVLDIHRQAIEGLARAHLNVADTDHFVLRSVLYQHAGVRASADVVRVQVDKALIRQREPGKCYAIGGEITSWAGTALVAHGGGVGAFVSPDNYEALRTTSDPRYWGLPPQIEAVADADALGLQHGEVLIGEVTYADDAASSTVGLDAAKHYFDRPLDHYPGLMLAAAARQLAVLAGARWTDVSVGDLEIESEAHQFLAFVELGSPPSLHARNVTVAGDRIHVLVQVAQFGAVRAVSLFTLRAERPQRAT